MFAFGVGLSLPLFIVGTFSGSLNVLPRAGVWMIEIKKIFGFLMLGMALRFLKIILPAFVTAWLWVILCAAAGLYFLKTAKKFGSLGRIAYNVAGIGSISGAILLAYFALNATLHPEDCSVYQLWTNDYVCGHKQALQQHKTLLLKIEAPCCSMCTAIDNKFFKQPVIIKTLEQLYVPVRIDGSLTDNPVIATLVKKFQVVGFPTILLINPDNETMIRKWSSDLYNLSVQEFKQILENAQTQV